MILYNITVIIEEEIEAGWLDFINHTFVPDALASNLLISNRILRVIDSPNEGITYCLQFISDNLENYTQFKDSYASQLFDAHALKFKNQAVFFSTIMEFIN
jgi:hypothetical protein